MATRDRKLRKRAHRESGYSTETAYSKPPKTPTPVLERSWFAAPVPGAVGTKHEGSWRPRSKKSIDRALEHRTNVAPARTKPKRTLRSLMLGKDA